MFNILKGSLEVAAKKDIRYYLNGVRVVRGESNDVRIYATDGHIASKVVIDNVDMVAGIAKNTDVILERASLEHALKLFKKNQDVPLVINESGGASISGLPIRLVDGRFPDVERTLNGLEKRNHDNQPIGVGIPALEHVVKASKAFLASEKYPCVKFNCGDANDKLSFEASLKDFTLLIIQMPARL